MFVFCDMAANKTDSKASQRKEDHIALAFQSQTGRDQVDCRFYYEPAINKMPGPRNTIELHFLDSNMSAPIWVSSMTGGTERARKINHNLARVCNEYKLGMGLGSCRQLLESDEYLPDFDVRGIIGIQPLYANLGIAQVIDIVRRKEFEKIARLLKRLRADGLIIHINPLQEWLQREGDVIDMIPVECIQEVLSELEISIIVKEVGQGFGPESLKALLDLNIAGIELAGFGGTNFSRVESLRNGDSYHTDLIDIGHTAEQMIYFLNEFANSDTSYLTKQIIISGGINGYLTGYYLNELCKFPSVYGQASTFLKYAEEGYEVLAKYVEEQIKGYQFAAEYLSIRR